MIFFAALRGDELGGVQSPASGRNGDIRSAGFRLQLLSGVTRQGFRAVLGFAVVDDGIGGHVSGSPAQSHLQATFTYSLSGRGIGELEF